MRPLLFTLLSLMIGGGIHAKDISHNDALKLRHKGEIVPLETLLDQVKLRHPKSQLLEVELERSEGRYVYEVDIITHDGEVREILIDAASGQILVDEVDD